MINYNKDKDKEKLRESENQISSNFEALPTNRSQISNLEYNDLDKSQ